MNKCQKNTKHKFLLLKVIFSHYERLFLILEASVLSMLRCSFISSLMFFFLSLVCFVESFAKSFLSYFWHTLAKLEKLSTFTMLFWSSLSLLFFLLERLFFDMLKDLVYFEFCFLTVDYLISKRAYCMRLFSLLKPIDI